jgi:hypothetical protein
MSVALIHADGVLRKLVGGYFIQEGVRLAQGLAANGEVYIVTTGEKDLLDQWLYTETGSRWWSESEGLSDSLVATARNLRGHRQFAIDLVVTADPEESAELVAVGFNVLQFTHAEFARPDWRPDYDGAIRPWETLSKQVADQHRLKAMEKPVRDD